MKVKKSKKELRDLKSKQGLWSQITQKFTKNEEEEAPQLHPLTGSAVEVGLMPEWIFEGFITISLAVPNIVFSGLSWYDTLHIMKWFITLVPIGIITVLAGARLAKDGPQKTGFVVDPFGLLWLVMLFFISLQPLWAPITSYPTFIKEWFALGGLVSVYLLSYNLFPAGNMIRIALWLANINAAVSVVFAELQIRNLCAPYFFIMNTPGNYIGNTGQQEMFGLWLAMAILNGIYLHIAYGGKPQSAGEQEKKAQKRHVRQGVFLSCANLAVLTVNAWGLWNSTARGGILSLVVGFFIFALMAWRNYGTAYIKRLAAIAAVLALVLAGTFAIGSMTSAGSRAEGLAGKTLDMIQNPGSIGFRIGIWRSSAEVFLANPTTGVGLGQFKWNYLPAQRAMFEKYPDGEWQFTFWAHNEYIQWFGEFGILGGLLLATMAAMWLFGFLKAVIKKENLPLEVLWASGMVFLISFNAVFSRPYHRIENVIWLALAFALTARAYIPVRPQLTFKKPALARVFGIFWAVAAVMGIFYMVDGMIGDRYMVTAMRTADAEQRMGWLQKAQRHLMYKEDAIKQQGYLLMQIGDGQQNAPLYAQGLGLLNQAFEARKDAQMMMDLITGYSKIGDIARVNELVAYLKPGTFSVQSQAIPPASSDALSK